MQVGNGHPVSSTHTLPSVEPDETSANERPDSRVNAAPEYEEGDAQTAPRRGSILARPLAWIHHILRSKSGVGLLDCLGNMLRDARAKQPVDRSSSASR